MLLTVSILHVYTFVVSRTFIAGAASQAGDADSSRAPGLTSGLQGSVNVNRGALLLAPQWQCISPFVFYIVIRLFVCYIPHLHAKLMLSTILCPKEAPSMPVHPLFMWKLITLTAYPWRHMSIHILKIDFLFFVKEERKKKTGAYDLIFRMRISFINTVW